MPKKYKNFVLFIVSLIFYGWDEPLYILLMLFSTFLDYSVGRGIERSRLKNSEKGAKLSNCIIMQDTIIGDNADLSHIIIDKDVTVGQGKTIIGCESYPMYIAKRSII